MLCMQINIALIACAFKKHKKFYLYWNAQTISVLVKFRTHYFTYFQKY